MQTGNAMTKRLFLFAGYDKSGVIDNTLVHYLSELSKLGDIVFVMDCDIDASELSKISDIPNVLYKSASRHGEYDFGSYKRAYQYADGAGILPNYDWVYLVNDSVYGPLFDLTGPLMDLESRGVDLTGMVDYRSETSPVQVQSWFVGISRAVATSGFLREFMNNISRQSDKKDIVFKYEVGLTQLILRNGYRMSTLVSGENGDVCHSVYHAPHRMLQAGIPFIKKNGLENLRGLHYLYPYTTEEIVRDIHAHATRTNTPIVRNNNYTKIFRISLLSIPLFTLYSQRYVTSRQVCYKGYLFDIVPLVKIFKRI